MKLFLYSRKSSEDANRQVQSIDDQIDIMRKLAEQRGIMIVDVLKESASAKAPGRPIFNSMIQRIYKGEAQGIICWKLDRLARNPVDGGNINWMLQQGTIQKIVTSDRDYVPGDNVLMMSVEFGMANQFILDLSKNTKRGMRSKCLKGWKPGVAQVGYLNNKYCDKGEKSIIRDPDRWDMVRKMWDMMLTGRYSPPQIMDIANDEWGFRMLKRRKSGGTPILRSTIYNMFSDPFYYGELVYGGEVYPGAHDPMVTKDEFDHVQKLIGRKVAPRIQKHTFAFSGFIHCGECGCSITAERKTKFIHSKGEIKVFTYYHCTRKKLNYPCKQGSITEEELVEKTLEFLGRIRISKHLFECTKKYLHLLYEQESVDRKHIVVSQQTSYNDCVRRLDNLIKLKISDGDLLTDEEFKEQKLSLLAEKKNLKDQLEQVDSKQNDAIRATESAFEFACYAQERFEAGDIEVRKGILAALGQNFTLKDHQLNIQAQHPYILIEEAVEKLGKEKARLEPQKTASVEALGDLSVSWLGRLDSNQ